MKHAYYFLRFFFFHISIMHLLLQCADSSQHDNRLDVMIPDDRFAIYLDLIEPRDTAEASTVTAGTPNTWADSGTAFLRYLSKNYTGKGRIEYVTNQDNPRLLRTLAEHVAQRTPLETKIGALTFKEQLGRAIERSTKAQEEIIDTLDKVDARGCPTHEGAEAMLRIVDACYLVIPSMHLMIAKTYLSDYVKVYKMETLLNDNIRKELQFVPKLLAAHQKKAHAQQQQQQISSHSSPSQSSSLPTASRQDSHPDVFVHTPPPITTPLKQSSPIPIPGKSHKKETPNNDAMLSLPSSGISVVPTILLDSQQSHEDSMGSNS